MKKMNLILVLALLIPCVVLAVEYDLNNYEMPDNYDHNLDMWLDMVGKVVNSEDYYFEKQEILNSDLGLEYDFKKFSRKVMLNIIGDLGLDNNGKYTTYQDTVHSFSDQDLLHLNSDIGILFRRYLGDKWYGQTCLDVSYYHGLNNSESQNFNQKRNTVFDANDIAADVKVGFGYGRIEDAGSACTARQILQELENSRLLARECSSNDVKILADELLRLETLNIFDSRELRKERYRQLWQKLKEMGLLINGDIESFVILRDLYELANVFERESGWEIAAGIYYNKMYSIEDNDIETYFIDDEEPDNDIYEYQDYEDTTDDYGVGINGAYSRVFALDWQFELTGEIYYYNIDSEIDHDKHFNSSYTEDVFDDFIKSDYEGYKFFLNAVFSWYPDTRTEFWSSAGIDYNKFKGDVSIIETDKDIVELWTDISEEYYQFAAGINYYISPRIQISGKIRYNICEYTGYTVHHLLPFKNDAKSLEFGFNVMYHLF
ncbi:MAG: hypothetical protein K9M99_09345 [Candidatus Cloacimonetes bacterium]|nr:hypothetical protein [Candidatus Cloacimonadota bacterium]